MSYIYIDGLGFSLKPEICERTFVYLLSLPANVPDHYQRDFCRVIYGTCAPSDKPFCRDSVTRATLYGPCIPSG